MKGSLEYSIIKETKVNVEVDEIVDELARIVDEKLEGYYLYDEEPYLENNDNGDSVEVYICTEGGEKGSPCDWQAIFAKSIKRLAQDIANGSIEEEPEE